jgi:large subunit ribosomal protein L10
VNRTEKTQYIADLNADLKASSVVVIAHYKGLTVAEMTNLRRKSREAGVRLKVTKNRLTKLSLKDTAFEGLSDMFTGPTLVAYAADPVAPAKAIADFAKTNDKLKVLGGGFGEKVMNPSQVEALAKMPSLNELRGQLVGLLQTPAQRVASVLQAPAGQLARVVGAYSKKDA